MFFNIILANLILAVFAKTLPHFTAKNTEAEMGAQYWEGLARLDLFKAYHQKDIQHKAKNVILFLGDGMGISTVTPSRILKGQLNGVPGEESKLVFEDFPNTCLIKTYNVDYQVPDSAGTATAFLTGVKSNKGVLGVNARVKRGETNCHLVQKNTLTSIFDVANAEGKSTGIVTTARVTHATPAAGYASIADRDWEGSLPASAANNSDPNGEECKDVARQLIENHPGNKLNVILGGGARYFYSKNDTDKPGRREDNLNLVNKWLDLRKEAGLKPTQFEFVDNRDQLLQTKANNKLEYLFGMFQDSHMNYDKERNPHQEPSIEEMTEAAIRLLQKNENGYVLLVEGGRIDMAHHDSYANLALYETVAFDKAIERALKLVSTEDTMIVVTADHSHGFTMSGYPVRGNNIMGIADKDEESNKPFTTLMYATGPGHEMKNRTDPSTVDTSALRYQNHAGVYLESANHGGEDVALYSIGPMSHLFRGTKEQNYVAHAMEMATCIGPYAGYDHCSDTNSSVTFNSQKTSLYLLLVLSVFIVLFNLIKS